MKVLIIKNDGFGDLILSLPILNGILSKKNKLQLDIVLSHQNLCLQPYLKNFRNIFFLKNLGNKFNSRKKISDKDKDVLSRIKSIYYDKCLVMRRNLNEENLKIIEIVRAKKIYICNENYPKNKDLLNKISQIACDLTSLKINKKVINEYDYYSDFIKKSGLNLKPLTNIFEVNNEIKESKQIVLNLSGEKQFSIASNFKLLLEMLLNNSSDKIVIIGVTFEKNLKNKINNILRKYRNNKRIVNLFFKTDFKQSMKIINKSNIYIGFETGLSHYAVWKKIKSLILLSSGGGHKWFPYPYKLRKNESYWMYNTPCSDCDYIGEIQCIFKTRYCVDNIFKNNLDEKFKKFLKERKKITNFSNYKNFISNWRYKSSRSFIYTFSKNGEIYLNNKFFVKMKYFFEVVKFVTLNKLYLFLFKKFLSKFL